MIGEDTIISNAIIGEHCVVGRNTCVNFLSAEEDVCIGDYCKVFGTENKPVSIGRGALVNDVVTIMQGVKLSSNSKTEMGEVLKAGESK